MKIALENHYLVDKFTDSHIEVNKAKLLFPLSKRRFTGIALDVLFDHLLIQNWAQFHDSSFNKFKENSYQMLEENLTIMPTNMQKVVYRITQDDWFKSYESIEGIGIAFDNIAKRIRFKINLQAV